MEHYIEKLRSYLTEQKAAREAEEAAEAERIAQERADMAPYIVGSID